MHLVNLQMQKSDTDLHKSFILWYLHTCYALATIPTDNTVIESGLVFATIFLSKAKGFSFSLFVSPVFYNCFDNSGQ